MARLNERQEEAVKYVSGPLLVLAGAGSGKTSVITQKIAYLIRECGLKGRNIVAVTFTNKAAREMKERVGKLIEGPGARGLTVSTFHNLGMNIIRKEYKTLGFKPGFSIFDQQDARALLAELMHKHLTDGEDSIDVVQHTISNWKNDLVSPQQAMDRVRNEQDLLAANVYSAYMRTLKAYNAVDFDDLILLPVQMFRDHPDVLARWQEKIHYMLVDEYQDTNSSQYLLVKQLVGTRAKFTVVGDDDQSIYAWRGARPENLIQLNEDYPALKLVKLEQNYRSTSRILRAANVLIANNPHVFEKSLWSQMGEGDEIRVIRTRNEDSEAERVATEILTHRLRHDTHWRDYAILYRGNFQSRLLEMKLQEHQIPYKLSGGQSFFSRAEVKDMMAYLRLLVNPDDDNAFLRIVNVPRREIGATTLEKLGTYANEHHVSLYSACHDAALEEVMEMRYVEKLRSFTRWMDTLSRNSEHDPMKAVHQLVAESDYESWIYQQTKSDVVAEKRMGNINFLVNSIQSTLERADEEASLEDAITRLILRDMMERQEEEEDDDRVQMLTLHASKGLEYPNVFMVGMEEDLLPHRTSIEEDNIEEERRLTYVGITRARERLVMTLAATRRQYGENLDTTPSRFLDELPQEDLVYEGWDQRSTPEQRYARGQEALNDILKGLDL
ncbi:DNA helicase Rep [Parendozoicomonas haliclonae]|uniref:ATP-dependent DNA helicase Rep n=1 Tax=Parendozoicomonas haliclonae TaxID=1960125 RepID=A0A1X7ALT0_9GAMM|nr:DNA helicase Rep [Parendozoicomonas haliclonae]SMA48597.1 ATP-dependent DNA helicase Rep [Parendozoicomonas haliclonae]